MTRKHPLEPTILVTHNRQSAEHFEAWLFQKYRFDMPLTPTFKLYGDYFDMITNKYDYREYCAYSNLKAS